MSVFAALTLASLWLWRERQVTRQRQVLRGSVRLSENLLDASSAREILTRLQKQTPALLDATHVDLYLFESAEDVLQQVAASDMDATPAIPVAAPIGSFTGAAALCFRNRMLIHISDTRSSPILLTREPKQPSSAIFVPMFAHGEPMGVVALYFSRKTPMDNPDQEVGLQHPSGTRFATSLKLQEQQTMRDQLLRTEKMAAAGQPFPRSRTICAGRWNQSVEKPASCARTRRLTSKCAMWRERLTAAWR